MTCSVNTIASLFSLQFMLNCLYWSSRLLLLQLRHIWKGKASLAITVPLNQNLFCFFNSLHQGQLYKFALICPGFCKTIVFDLVFLQIFEANIKSLILQSDLLYGFQVLNIVCNTIPFSWISPFRQDLTCFL
jgi:hypothetical protein